MYMIKLTKKLVHEWTYKLVDPDLTIGAPIYYVTVHQPPTGTASIYFGGLYKQPSGNLRFRIAKANHDNSKVGCEKIGHLKVDINFENVMLSSFGLSASFALPRYVDMHDNGTIDIYFDITDAADPLVVRSFARASMSIDWTCGSEAVTFDKTLMRPNRMCSLNAGEKCYTTGFIKNKAG
jgi:hypothetical protein